MSIVELYAWVTAHKEDIAAVYGCAVAFCTAVIKLFPSNKSSSFWGKIVKVMDYLSTAYTDTDAEKLKKAK